MDHEVVLLVERLASIVESISQDVRSISHSTKEVNCCVLEMVKKKHSTTVSVPGIRDDSNRETFSEKGVEKNPSFSHVLERLVVAVESLPHEVRNISLSLKDINENISCLSRQEDSVSQDIFSRIDDSTNKEECPMERTHRSPVKKERIFTSGMESPSASSQDEIDFLKENPGGETCSSQSSFHESDVFVVKKSGSNEVFGEEGAYKSTNPLVFHDYAKSFPATDVSKLDPHPARIGKIQQIPNKPEKSSKNTNPLCVINYFSVTKSSSKQVRAFEQSTSGEVSVLEKKMRATLQRSLENVTVEGDSVSSSVTTSLQPLGVANKGPSGCSERNACLAQQPDRSEEPETNPLKCPTCIKTFHDRDDLYFHLSSHCKESLFKCGYCKKMFALKSHLYSHMEKHSNEDLTKYNESSSTPILDIGPMSSSAFQCRSSFRSIDALKQYIPSLSLEKLHQCGECGKKFPRKDGLIRHQRVHNQERPYLCEHCGKGFSEKRYLDNHVHIHTGKKLYGCKLCNKSFVHRVSLVIHMRCHTGEKPYKCKECGKAYARSEFLTRHMHIHRGQRPYKCSICLSAFASSSELIRHKIVHVRERRFACTECESLFKDKHHLKCHNRRVHEPKVRVHRNSGSPPFLCDHCGKGFNYKKNLTVHVRLHTGEKPYKCNVCDKSFAQSYAHVVHMRGHTGEKPHQCGECGKAFITSGSLSYHKQKNHTAERPYKCDVCGSAFVNRDLLKRHKQRHGDERPYACPQCKRCFKRKSYLSQHQRRVHKVTDPPP